MQNTLSTSRMTARISVPCTEELKKKIQDNAQKAQMTESEFIRRVLENNTAAFAQPTNIDEKVRRNLCALYRDQVSERERISNDFSTLIRTYNALCKKIDYVIDNGYLSRHYETEYILKPMLILLLQQIQNLEAQYTSNAECRLRYYYNIYRDNYNDQDILFK